MTRGSSLVVPIHTASEISHAQLRALLTLVAAGVGIGGVHGGMCAAFRQATEYHFMIGGQWVAHPGDADVTYSVHVVDRGHVITRGSPSEFSLTSEQYYMHVDPANHVLATTRFPTPGVGGPHLRNGAVGMPVIWTKYYGKGRVFYCSIGHQVQNVRQPEVLRLCTRGLLWAAGSESLLS
ncbi:MAG: ThuA domain-containing protein [Ktedonobacterales bacterium]